MQDRIADLTDKEKEALRLLLAGHDAKSSASELGISVHTVNDRLRNARRKMEVSSSREAARILGDAEEAPEAAAPQNPVHTSLGIADPAIPANTADLNNAKPTRLFGLTWLAGGMLIMSIIIAAAVLAVVSTSGEDATTVAATAPENAAFTNEDAESAESYPIAEKFIASIDAGEWAQSWNDAGEFFQAETSIAEWSRVVEPVRSPLGDVEERRLLSVQRLSTLPGAPEGDYEVLEFQTKYENVETLSIETVIMVRNGNKFDVAGYFIR